MNRIELTQTLDVLRLARASLIERTCSEEPELFTKLYQFENNRRALSLSFEQEFIDWINRHFELAEAKGLLDSTVFLQTILQLMGRHQALDEALLKEMGAVSNELLQQKREIIQSIIQADMNSEKNYQRLLYSLEKDKALFQRQFNQLLSEENHGDFE
ncbi:hypothetical protein [Conchiformibius steedae]|uniref:Uncharacterized protein n=1 Tax=Conchiformibius steedae TaxID=153493 RepID=A0A3P2A4K4_9NEIS|nr:hypothetical protein [Conchiformibius steedae]RRD89838.1 hypothetical protein EII21_07305 [Conchiformibius steedae]